MVDYDVLKVPSTEKLKMTSTNRAFYDLLVDEKKMFAYKYQLYTFAIMVAISKGAAPDTSTKSVDICFVHNAERDKPNFDVAQGLVAHISPDVKRGSELMKRMNEYADAGINILKEAYEMNDGEIDIGEFFD
ncbi:MAG: hypothetical protein IJG07_03035 [Prevotella sp.]|nr:hypothetical protein [Prevotella sp.]